MKKLLRWASGLVLAVLLLGPFVWVGSVLAQNQRPPAPSDAEAQCADLRGDWRERVRVAEKEANRGVAKGVCLTAKVECDTRCKGAFDGQCRPTDSSVSDPCAQCWSACRRAAAKCLATSNIDAKAAALGKAQAWELCTDLPAHGCPLKKIGRWDEPRMCGQLATEQVETGDEWVPGWMQ